MFQYRQPGYRCRRRPFGYHLHSMYLTLVLMLVPLRFVPGSCPVPGSGSSSYRWRLLRRLRLPPSSGSCRLRLYRTTIVPSHLLYHSLVGLQGSVYRRCSYHRIPLNQWTYSVLNRNLLSYCPAYPLHRLVFHLDLAHCWSRRQVSK